MIHGAITPELVREWTGTDAGFDWYEHHIDGLPQGADPEWVEAFARSAAERSAKRKGIVLTGEPLVVRTPEGSLLVLWVLAAQVAGR